MKKVLRFFLFLIFSISISINISLSLSSTFVSANKLVSEITKTNSTIQIGEKLNYTIKWNGLSAAKMSLETEKVTKENKPVYKLELKLFTIGLARDIFQLNNVYTTFVDTNTELPKIVERNLLQGSKVEQNVLVYDQEKHTVTIANDKPIAIMPNTHDLSSILWAIRSASLKSDTERITVFNSNDKKTMTLEIETGKKEEISLAKGSFFARELVVKIQEQEKSFSDKYSIRIWVTDDQSRTPLLIAAQPSFGKIKIELVNSETEEDSDQ